MIPNTIDQLLSWMRTNCYNRNYQILEDSDLDGIGLGLLGAKYYWFSRERGQMEIHQFFPTEQEAASFVFEVLSSDKNAKRHLLRMENNRLVVNHLYIELSKRGLVCEVEEVHTSKGNAFNIFLFGCDIKKALDLKYKEF